MGSREIRTREGGRPADRPGAEHLSPILELYLEFGHLKQLFRQGWLRRGVPEGRCETVAEHSFGVALLTILLADRHFPDLDAGKAARMALLHEAGEIDAGDIIPADGVDDAEKRELEERGVRRLFREFPGGADYIALWEEFEEGASPEARLVRQVDKLEMACQAGIYSHSKLIDASRFYQSTRERLHSPELLALLDEIISLDDGSPPR